MSILLLGFICIYSLIDKGRKEGEIKATVETLVECNIEKAEIIERIIKKYGHLSVFELVRITHVAGVPWDSVDKDSPYTEIPDSLILERHYKETELVPAP